MCNVGTGSCQLLEDMRRENVVIWRLRVVRHLERRPVADTGGQVDGEAGHVTRRNILRYQTRRIDTGSEDGVGGRRGQQGQVVAG